MSWKYACPGLCVHAGETRGDPQLPAPSDLLAPKEPKVNVTLGCGLYSRPRDLQVVAHGLYLACGLFVCGPQAKNCFYIFKV